MVARDILSAGVVVFGPGRTVLLVHRPKYDDWSLPKGKLDPGESWEDAALREVEEEIGFQADIWVEGPSYFSSAGMTDEVTHVFLATGLRKVGGVEEGIELVPWPLSDLDGLIDGNADASTLIGLLWLRRAHLLGGAAATGAT